RRHTRFSRDWSSDVCSSDLQLSLAIGRDGQNARLAARLTGWKIDIKSESQQAELAVLEAQRAFDEAEAALRAREEARARAEAERSEERRVGKGGRSWGSAHT